MTSHSLGLIDEMNKPDPVITAVARAFRVAFLVEDGHAANDWLDLVFDDSFGRHAGRQSLVVPVLKGEIPPPYLSWLKAYDPDVLWLISTESEKLADLVRRYCSPIYIRALSSNIAAEHRLLVRYGANRTPLTSLSWLPFLQVTSGGVHARPEAILDCYPQWEDDGLITDNFGTLHRSCSRFPIHREISNVVKPLMLTPPDAPGDRWRFGIDANEVTDGYAALELLLIRLHST